MLTWALLNAETALLPMPQPCTTPPEAPSSTTTFTPDDVLQYAAEAGATASVVTPAARNAAEATEARTRRINA